MPARRPGQPPRIDSIVGRKPNGDPITAFDRILELLRAGAYFETATTACGITRETGYEWRRRGARLHTDLATAKIQRTDLSHHDKRCMAFSDAVALAEAEWEANANVLLEQIARGGMQVKTVTERVDTTTGQVLERTEKVERTLPDAKVLLTRLGQRFPERYRKRIEVTGAEGEPLIDTDRIANLLSLARQVDADPSM